MFNFIWIRKLLLGISDRETEFKKRKFYVGNLTTKNKLEKIGHTFLQGYSAVLEEEDLNIVTSKLNLMESEFRGFAYEGAAMGFALLDYFFPKKQKRLLNFLEGSGSSHTYMAHVGVGWIFARLNKPIEPFLSQLDPLLRWLSVDGYGFHEGYFKWQRYFKRQEIPSQLTNDECRIFDQGLGRSLWFVNCADVNRISETIASFKSSRHADLWSGVGLACAYAGGVSRTEIEALQVAAKSYKPHLAQGAAFAAKARQLANNPAVHTEIACEVLCRISANEAAQITDVALEGLSNNGTQTTYETWQQKIRHNFASTLLAYQ